MPSGQVNSARTAFFGSNFDKAIKSLQGGTGGRFGGSASPGRLIEEYVKLSSKPEPYPVFEFLQPLMTAALRHHLVVVDEAFDYLAPLLALQSAVSPLTVATLNYDLGMESVARRHAVLLVTGAAEWDGSFEWVWPDETSLRLIKLHGSVDWNGTGGGRDMRELQRITLSQNPRDEREPPLVVFGQRGMVRADGPFLALLRAFEVALAKADRLIVVGYSLRDAHVNVLLQRWLANDRDRGLVVVDPAFNAGWGGYTEGSGPRLLQSFGRDQYPGEGDDVKRFFVDNRKAEVALPDLLST